METDRRCFLQLSGMLAGAALLPCPVWSQERFITAPGPWRKFDISTEIRFPKPEGRAQAWLPVPSLTVDDWVKALGSDWQTNAADARVETVADADLDLVYLEWDGPATEATATLSSHAETRDRLTDFTKPVETEPLGDEARSRYTAPASFAPHTRWLQETAASITENAQTDLGKAKAIYEWIVEERTCETDDLKVLFGAADMEMETPQGCDYLTTLFVHLARVSGLPAREVYGVRAAPSQFGFDSLGAIPKDITAETSARAEVWLGNYGWVPASPGDVRRVIRSEAPGNLELTDAKVVSARVTLFGAWEGNWVAYNMANDFTLPASDGAKVPFLTAPRIRTANGWLHEAETPGFHYRVTASELPA